jgi:hypothetical protein
MTLAKRYVLFLAEEDISEPEKKSLRATIERRHPGDKLIEVQGNPRALIVKTTNELAMFLRDQGAPVIGGKKLTPLLTSGAVGNLKRRASEAATNGQVHE